LVEQVAGLKAENERLSHQITLAAQSPALSSDRLRELLKLRGEVGLLRRELKETLAAQSKALTSHNCQRQGCLRLRLLLSRSNWSWMRRERIPNPS
jgi:hypothetical protein